MFYVVIGGCKCQFIFVKDIGIFGGMVLFDLDFFYFYNVILDFLGGNYDIFDVCCVVYVV